MSSQERLPVAAAAERLGISQDAVRSRIKRGTLWALRRRGRVLVVLNCSPGPSAAAADAVRAGATAPSTNGALERLSAEVEHARCRILELQRERDRLLAQLTRQQRFLEREQVLRRRLQERLDRLSERLFVALPEIEADPSAGADRLWRRLERQIERLNRG